MFVPGDSLATRRHLPHIENYGKSYFVTFTTVGRIVLAPEIRSTALNTILFEHTVTCFVDCAVIMPDHAHLILTPYETWRFSKIMQRIKSVSSHDINKAIGRRGRLWLDESFDRILREGDLDEKRTYICNNPVNEGLVATPDDYPWLWRWWVEGAHLGQAPR
jgi:putative transposase